MALRTHSSSTSSGWHLASIQVKAFKSFSRSASFNLDSSGLVGIVGPNGCGKSNLLEAVCFACGCSTAVLRGCRSFKDVTSTDAGSQVGNFGSSFQCILLSCSCDNETCSRSATGLAGTLLAIAGTSVGKPVL
jgi:ABC-type glutathione transport system ATPase component